MVGRCDFTFVHCVLFSAVAAQWTLVFFSAVAWLCDVFLRGKGVVVFFYDPLYVFGAAKLTLMVFLLKSLWSLLDLGKCLSTSVKRYCNVGSSVLTEWWVEPDDVSFSCSFLLSRGC